MLIIVLNPPRQQGHAVMNTTAITTTAPRKRPARRARNAVTITAADGDALAAALAKESKSVNTRRAYKSAIDGLREFLAATAQALSDSSLAAYIATLHARGLAPASGRQVLAAVRFAARKAGVDSPVGEQSKDAMKGFARDGAGRGRGQAAALSWRQADTAAAVASTGGVRGKRDAAIIAVMSDALLRSSELRALQVGDFTTADDGTGRLTIRKSKTDQTGKGAVMFLGAPTVDRVTAWLTVAGIDGGHLFRQVRRGGHVGDGALSTNAIARIIKSRVAGTGIDAKRISGHSARIGGAVELAAAGESIASMQTAGRWSSPDMPGRYARAELASRGAVARRRYGIAGS